MREEEGLIATEVVNDERCSADGTNSMISLSGKNHCDDTMNSEDKIKNEIIPATTSLDDDNDDQTVADISMTEPIPAANDNDSVCSTNAIAMSIIEWLIDHIIELRNENSAINCEKDQKSCNTSLETKPNDSMDNMDKSESNTEINEHIENGSGGTVNCEKENLMNALRLSPAPKHTPEWMCSSQVQKHEMTKEGVHFTSPIATVYLYSGITATLSDDDTEILSPSSSGDCPTSQNTFLCANVNDNGDTECDFTSILKLDVIDKITDGIPGDVYRDNENDNSLTEERANMSNIDITEKKEGKFNCEDMGGRKEISEPDICEYIAENSSTSDSLVNDNSNGTVENGCCLSSCNSVEAFDNLSSSPKLAEVAVLSDEAKNCDDQNDALIPASLNQNDSQTKEEITYNNPTDEKFDLSTRQEIFEKESLVSDNKIELDELINLCQDPITPLHLTPIDSTNHYYKASAIEIKSPFDDSHTDVFDTSISTADSKKSGKENNSCTVDSNKDLKANNANTIDSETNLKENNFRIFDPSSCLTEDSCNIVDIVQANSIACISTTDTETDLKEDKSCTVVTGTKIDIKNNILIGTEVDLKLNNFLDTEIDLKENTTTVDTVTNLKMKSSCTVDNDTESNEKSSCIFDTEVYLKESISCIFDASSDVLGKSQSHCTTDPESSVKEIKYCDVVTEVLEENKLSVNSEVDLKEESSGENVKTNGSCAVETGENLGKSSTTKSELDSEETNTCTDVFKVDLTENVSLDAKVELKVNDSCSDDNVVELQASSSCIVDTSADLIENGHCTIDSKVELNENINSTVDTGMKWKEQCIEHNKSADEGECESGKHNGYVNSAAKEVLKVTDNVKNTQETDLVNVDSLETDTVSATGKREMPTDKCTYIKRHKSKHTETENRKRRGSEEHVTEYSAKVQKLDDSINSNVSGPKSPKMLKQLSSDKLVSMDENIEWEQRRNNSENETEILSERKNNDIEKEQDEYESLVCSNIEDVKKQKVADSHYAEVPCLTFSKNETLDQSESNDNEVVDEMDMEQCQFAEQKSNGEKQRETDDQVVSSCNFMTATEYLSQSSQNSGSTGFVFDATECLADACMMSLNTHTINGESIEQDCQQEILNLRQQKSPVIQANQNRSVTLYEIDEANLNEEKMLVPLNIDFTKLSDEGTVPDETVTHDEDEQMDTALLDLYIDKAVDQMVPGYNSNTDVKLYACDADICDDLDVSVCKPISEIGNSAGGPGCFKWKYTPSCDADVVTQKLPDEDQVIRITPLKTCGKPLRLGLSKRQPMKKSLHNIFKH